MYNFFSKRLNGNRKGFTLVELLVVMAILAVLIAIAVMNMGNTTMSAKIAKHNAQVRELHSSASMWYSNNVNLPAVVAATDASPHPLTDTELKKYFNADKIPTPEVGVDGASPAANFTITVTSTGKVKVSPAILMLDNDGKAQIDTVATAALQGN